MQRTGIFSYIFIKTHRINIIKLSWSEVKDLPKFYFDIKLISASDVNILNNLFSLIKIKHCNGSEKFLISLMLDENV